jgi:hypothetical protein
LGGLLRYFNDRREMETGSKTPPRAKPTPISIPQPAAIRVIIPLPPRSPQSLDTPRLNDA